MKILKSALVATAAIGAMALASSASAQAFYSDLATWQAAMGTWSETTSFGAGLFSDFSSFTTTDGVNITIVPDGNDRIIGSGWATWCCGYTGEVEYTNGALSQTWTFNNPVHGFGVFMEPNPFSLHDMTLSVGLGSLTQTVDGDSGAKFFGFIGDGFGSATLSSDVDFAAGDVFTGAVGGIPEPATWAIMLVGFGGLGAALRRRKALVVA